MVLASPQIPIAELRRLMARTQSIGMSGGPDTAVLGDEIDAVLPGGGLALGAVHEISEQGTDRARASLSSLFAASILARRPGAVICCLHSRDLFAPALARVVCIRIE
jgi:protein ImuA